MKRSASILIALVLATTFASAATAGVDTPRVAHRHAAQHHRIREGVRNGRLTPGEARRLRHGERRIHRTERRMKADGSVSRRDRVRLDRLQDRESRRIYRLKHNRRSI